MVRQHHCFCLSYGAVLHQLITIPLKVQIMTRQSISLTAQNDAWLRDHVENIGDYASKSELVNDLIRRARRSEMINKKLELAEQSGFVEQSAAQMLSDFKATLGH